MDTRKLMDVYSESNYENADYFFPDEADKEAAVQIVEAGFLDFLKNNFFKKAEAAYWVLEIDVFEWWGGEYRPLKELIAEMDEIKRKRK